MKVLITTTINVPTVLVQWAASMEPGDQIIVAGDMKSPHQEICRLLISIEEKFDIGTTYLGPDRQTHWAMSEATGWNCIQRRNIALLEAMKLNPEFIITVDDDNFPTHGRHQITALTQRINGLEPTEHKQTMYVQSSTGWWNPGYFLQADDPFEEDQLVVHRGFPLSRRHEQPSCPIKSRKVPDDVKIGVAAMLWTGDPDIDAIERMINRPTVSHNAKNMVLAPGTWAPFNSQATMYRAELAPLMMVWPGVGRYDDIWASYLARCVMDYFGYSVYYGSPVVHQDRNEHDLIKDLEQEMFGMKHNESIISALRTASNQLEPHFRHRFHGAGSNEQVTIREAMDLVLGYVAALSILPTATVNAFHAWFADLDTLGIV